jgi:hypothetical protein
MLREEYRIEETWAANKRWSVDTSFVAPALSQFRNPVIESLNLRVFGTVRADSVTIESYDHVQFVANANGFKVTDKRGDRIDCSPRGLRIVAQQELGSHFQDPADQGSSTNSSFEVNLPITFHPERSDRPNDFLMTVREFLDCNVIWNGAAATPITASTIVSALTMQLQARVREGATTDAPARMQILEVSAEKAEETFTTDGGLRYAMLYAYNSGSDLTGLSTYTEVDSRTLRLNDQPTSSLRQQCNFAMRSLDATADEVTRRTVIPLIFPDRDQHLSQIFNPQGKLHIKLQAALPTGGKLLTVGVTGRDEATTAKLLGYGSVGEMFAAIQAGQVEVVGTRGTKPVAAAGLAKAAFFPLRRKGA